MAAVEAAEGVALGLAEVEQVQPPPREAPDAAAVLALVVVE